MTTDNPHELMIELSNLADGMLDGQGLIEGDTTTAPTRTIARIREICDICELESFDAKQQVVEEEARRDEAIRALRQEPDLREFDPLKDNDPMTADEALALAMAWARGQRSYTNLINPGSALGYTVEAVAVFDAQEVVKWTTMASAMRAGEPVVTTISQDVLDQIRSISGLHPEAMRDIERFLPDPDDETFASVLKGIRWNLALVAGELKKIADNSSGGTNFEFGSIGV